MAEQTGGLSSPSAGADIASIAGVATDQTLQIVERTNKRVAGMLKQGYGPTFLAFGFVTVLGSVVLRLSNETEITPTIFIALLVLGIVFVGMSFVFLYTDAQMRQEMVRTVAEHNEKVMGSLLEYQRGLQEQQATLAQDITKRGEALPEHFAQLKGPGGPQ